MELEGKRLSQQWARRWTQVACLVLLALPGCAKSTKSDSSGAMVGVFYGGQVQERKLVEVSSIQPPKLGFRVTLDALDAQQAQTIHYEIVQPGPAGRRVTRRGDLSVPPGRGQVDHTMELDADSRMGLWNVRVTHGERVLADRALFLKRPR